MLLTSTICAHSVNKYCFYYDALMGTQLLRGRDETPTGSECRRG